MIFRIRPGIGLSLFNQVILNFFSNIIESLFILHITAFSQKLDVHNGICRGTDQGDGNPLTRSSLPDRTVTQLEVVLRAIDLPFLPPLDS